MALPKYKKSHRVDGYFPDGEFNSLPSCTVPDQSLSIKDILYRFTKGMPLDNIVHNVTFGDDFENQDDNFEVHPMNQFGLDIIDVHNMAESSAYVIERAEQIQRELSQKRDDDFNDDANKE